MTSAVLVAAAENPYGQSFGEGLHHAIEMIGEGNPQLVEATLRTLRLAFETTAIAALVGIPIGCLVGIGSFPGRGLVLAVLSAFTRIPPVLVGVVGLLLLFPESPWGGGPLSGLGWYTTAASAYLVQALVALPIVTALTATAVQGVPVGLLEQARAFGASRRRLAVLALREARLSVLSAVLVALGVTMTAVGALLVVGAPGLIDSAAPFTLAVGALLEVRNGNGAEALPYAVAYSTILFGLFVLLAAVLTRLQHGGRRSTS